MSGLNSSNVSSPLFSKRSSSTPRSSLGGSSSDGSPSSRTRISTISSTVLSSRPSPEIQRYKHTLKGSDDMKRGYLDDRHINRTSPQSERNLRESHRSINVPNSNSRDETVRKSSSLSPKLLNSEFSCPICSKSFNDEKELNKHIYGGYSWCGRKLMDVMSKDEDVNNENGSSSGSSSSSVNRSFDSIDSGSAPTREAIVKSVPSFTAKPKDQDRDSNKLIVMNLCDYESTCHWRYAQSLSSHRLKIENVLIISSIKDQYSFDGREACTTIAIEAATQILFDVIDTLNIKAWNDRVIDRILKQGCMQDSQLGRQSFSEVYNSKERFLKQLRVLDAYTDTISDLSFEAMMNNMISAAKRNQSSVCAVITKQPETILLYYRNDNEYQPFFLVFDSHPRTTDGIAHGAHVIYFLQDHHKEFPNVRKYLNEWMFPVVEYPDERYNHLYNSFTYTIICAALDQDGERIYYSPLLLEEDEKNFEHSTLQPSLKQINGSKTIQVTSSKDSGDSPNDIESLREEVQKLRVMNNKLLKEREDNAVKIHEYEEEIQELKEKSAAVSQELVIFKDKVAHSLRSKLDQYYRLRENIIQLDFSSLERFIPEDIESGST